MRREEPLFTAECPGPLSHLFDRRGGDPRERQPLPGCCSVPVPAGRRPPLCAHRRHALLSRPAGQPPHPALQVRGQWGGRCKALEAPSVAAMPAAAASRRFPRSAHCPLLPAALAGGATPCFWTPLTAIRGTAFLPRRKASSTWLQPSTACCRKTGPQRRTARHPARSRGGPLTAGTRRAAVRSRGPSAACT